MRRHLAEQWGWYLIAAMLAGVAVIIFFAIRADNRFRTECEAGGGHVESHQEGWITTYTPILDGKGNQIGLIPNTQPNMVNTCEH